MHDHGTGGLPVGLAALRESGLSLVAVRGEVDDVAAADLAARLQQAASGPRPQVVVDLAGVTALSPAGLSALLHAQEVLERRGGTLELLDPSPSVVLLLHEALAGG